MSIQGLNPNSMPVNLTGSDLQTTVSFAWSNSASYEAAIINMVRWDDDFVKLALISLSKEEPDGGPIGLLPLFDSTIAEKQVRCALETGAEKIVFLCPIMPGAILQYIDALKARGIDAEIVRRASDLVQYASHDNHLIFIGDGILPSSELEQKLAEQVDEIIYVVANSEIYEDLERIDLNQRWLGLLALKASRLSMLIDVPDDWNIGSALLRIAVQSECPRELVSDSRMVAGEVIHLENGDEAAEYTRRKLANPKLNSGNILDKFIFWPITRRILPGLWQVKDACLYLRGATVIAVLLALLTAYFQLIVPTLGLLVVASIIHLVGHRVDLFSESGKRRNPTGFVAIILANIALLLLVLGASSSASMTANIIVLALLWINMSTIETSPDIPILRSIRPDKSFPIIILLIAAIFDQFLFGIYFATLWGATYVGTASCYRARSDRKPQTSV